jgi:hypothetical protein
MPGAGSACPRFFCALGLPPLVTQPMKHSSFVPALALAFIAPVAECQIPEPQGLAAAALANQEFNWLYRETPGFRVYFLADSYPARHQDSLLPRLPAALAHAERLIEVKGTAGPIDLFFVENRPQMEALVGGRATGFAQPSARAVFLMTNSEWRAFERHEIMHVVSGQQWGRALPGNDWLQEGLAQFADGDCAGYQNSDIALALAAKHGWIPWTDVLTRFRQQADLRAYLQAASFVKHLHQRFGAAAIKRLWIEGVTAETRVNGVLLSTIERNWRTQLVSTRVPSSAELDQIEEKGCG